MPPVRRDLSLVLADPAEADIEVLRDRVYIVLHQGKVQELIAG
ncbi:hypothetical protein JOE31_001138 [Arthrobacter sp. PvP023]|nr:hypothetical protein [Arthrobacter sp. PvP023]MBP1134906.1 hypothetical protein [Arthrobacter sp. PvP023]